MLAYMLLLLLLWYCFCIAIVLFGDTISTPLPKTPRVSSIIWMAPKLFNKT